MDRTDLFDEWAQTPHHEYQINSLERWNNPVPLHLVIDEILQADLRSASSAIDAAREAIASKQTTKKEGELMLEAALKRYATALRRLSRWAAAGKAPRDLR